MIKHLNIKTLKTELVSSDDNIIFTDARVANWYIKCPDGYKGEWINGIYKFVEIPPITDEELLAKEQADFRATRNTELVAVDILVYIAQDTDNGNVAELRRYRQALRQSTKTWVMPTREEYGVI